jgi:hypothetical protein
MLGKCESKFLRTMLTLIPLFRQTRFFFLVWVLLIFKPEIWRAQRTSTRWRKTFLSLIWSCQRQRTETAARRSASGVSCCTNTPSMKKSFGGGPKGCMFQTLQVPVARRVMACSFCLIPIWRERCFRGRMGWGMGICEMKAVWYVGICTLKEQIYDFEEI